MSVVVGVDVWAESVPAVRWAAREALLREQPLTIVHTEPERLHHLRPDDLLLPALEHDPVADATEIALHEGDVEVQTRSVTGDVAQRLLDAVPDASVLVVGHHHLGAVRSLTHGSVGLRLAARASCPVVVVPAGSVLPVSGDVLVGVDVQVPGAADVLRVALDEARLRHARLVAVAAYSRFAGPLSHDRALSGRSDAQVHDLVSDELARVVRDCQTATGSSVPVDGVVVAEDPSHALERRGRHVALSVVGSHGHGSIVGTALGSVPHHLLRVCDHPVVVVHLPRDPRTRVDSPD